MYQKSLPGILCMFFHLIFYNAILRCNYIFSFIYSIQFGMGTVAQWVRLPLWMPASNIGVHRTEYCLHFRSSFLTNSLPPTWEALIELSSPGIGLA